MSRTASGEILFVLVGAVIYGVGFLIFPSGEDWFPLNDDYRGTAIYYDRNSLSWKGNVVFLSTKTINKDGAPFKSSPWMVENKSPQGFVIDLSIDCQQRLAKNLNLFLYVREGHYAKLPLPEKLAASQVLDSSNQSDQKVIALCDSERPGWHPFRYKLVRDFFPSLSADKQS